jgi:hypothetical protein
MTKIPRGVELNWSDLINLLNLFTCQQIGVEKMKIKMQLTRNVKVEHETNIMTRKLFIYRCWCFKWFFECPSRRSADEDEAKTLITRLWASAGFKIPPRKLKTRKKFLSIWFHSRSQKSFEMKLLDDDVDGESHWGLFRVLFCIIRSMLMKDCFAFVDVIHAWFFVRFHLAQFLSPYHGIWWTFASTTWFILHHVKASFSIGSDYNCWLRNCQWILERIPQRDTTRSRMPLMTQIIFHF